jgi:chromosome segregation ATPase
MIMAYVVGILFALCPMIAISATMAETDAEMQRAQRDSYAAIQESIEQHKALVKECEDYLAEAETRATEMQQEWEEFRYGLATAQLEKLERYLKYRNKETYWDFEKTLPPEKVGVLGGIEKGYKSLVKYRKGIQDICIKSAKEREERIAKGIKDYEDMNRRYSEAKKEYYRSRKEQDAAFDSFYRATQDYGARISREARTFMMLDILLKTNR